MSGRLLLLAGLRHHARRPLQSALAVLGIALGTALQVGVHASLGSAERAFERAGRELVGDATHVLRGGQGGVPAEALGVLARELGVEAAAPVVTTVARLPGTERRILQVFGCDPLAEAPLRAFAGGDDAARTLPLAALLTEPGAFVAGAATLARLGVAVGDPLPLRVLGRDRAARCVGVLADDRVPDDVLVVDVATAQEWRGKPGAVDRVDLRLEPAFLGGRGAAEVAAAIERRLGPALRLEPPPGRDAFERLTRAFRTNLQALSLLSLLVSAFLVHATMRVAVLRRRESFAVLRALGTPARSLFAAVAGEALLLGAFGALLGVGAGALGAEVLLGPVLRTLNDHYATFDVHGVAWTWDAVLPGALLGTAVAVLAALGPAREAAAVPPREVLVHARAPVVRTGRAWPWVAAVVGIALLAIAGPRIEVAYAGLFLALLAAAAAAPAVLQGVLALLERTKLARSPWLAYVLRSTRASRARTGTAVGALALALATTVGLGMLTASFRTSVQQWMGQVLPADVYVGIAGGVDERTQAVLAPATVRALEGIDGLAAVSTYRRLRLSVQPAREPGAWTLPVEVVAWGPSPRVLGSLPFVHGDGAAARAAFAQGEGMLVSEPLAFQRGIGVGDRLLVPTDAGPVALPVVGVFRDYGSAQGVAMVPAALLAGGIGSLALEARAGVSPDELAERARAAAATGPDEVAVTTQARLRADSLLVFDRTFAVTAALRLFVVLVAALGIWGAFAALQLERAAEIGLLRTLGALPRRVTALVLGQTALLGLGAGLLALPVGVGLGYVMVHVLNRGSFGWTLLEVRLPWQVAVEALALALGAALLAGVQPALRFAKLRPAAALRED